MFEALADKIWTRKANAKNFAGLPNAGIFHV
jgi:hypothetical protein